MGIIFKFAHQNITWHEVPISMQPPNCKAKKVLVIKKNRPIINKSKRMKLILDSEYKKIDLKSITINMNYLNEKIYFLLKLLI